MIWLIEEELNPFLDFRQRRRDGRSHPNPCRKKCASLAGSHSGSPAKRTTHVCKHQPQPISGMCSKILQERSSPNPGLPISGCCSLATEGIWIAYVITHFSSKLNLNVCLHLPICDTFPSCLTNDLWSLNMKIYVNRALKVSSSVSLIMI